MTPCLDILTINVTIHHDLVNTLLSKMIRVDIYAYWKFEPGV